MMDTETQYSNQPILVCRKHRGATVFNGHVSSAALILVHPLSNPRNRTQMNGASRLQGLTAGYGVTNLNHKQFDLAQPRC